ncbi:MAG: short chain dehydrogenase [Deltaproteobacteria bacterium]|jgi:NAD(P)-dependent dehydrogenase (short-subunit alcohol dehydrogenase family)|nr:short chain dehydrogenase [Deltaproteobacteria bacterium]
MAGDFDGRAALVTGAGAGIGRAIALALANEGASVVVADIAVDGGEETLRLIEEDGGRAIFVATDVSQPEQVQALVTATVDTYGQLDCAFNNAGIARESQLFLADTPLEIFDQIIDVNLRGVFLCMKYELQQMLSQGGGGAIVNTASTMAWVASPGSPIYSASKHGVVGLTKSAAIAYADQGIRINAVCPGNTDTAILAPTKAKASSVIDALIENTPLRRLADPMEIAKAALWLGSDGASFCTGHAMLVDGGFVAH